MIETYIKFASVARDNVGEKVYWDEVSSRYVYLRSGILTDVIGRNVAVDGNYKLMNDRLNFRNFEMGGEWLKNKEASK